MNDDHVFKALADPTRRHLLDRLFERDGRTLTELESELEMSRFGVMKHLRVLEDAGLVEHRSQGVRSVYAVRVQGLASVREFLDEFWDTALSQLEELAKE
jgi:DNA-binding transcriptional ArsR family regulator